MVAYKKTIGIDYSRFLARVSGDYVFVNHGAEIRAPKYIGHSIEIWDKFENDVDWTWTENDKKIHADLGKISRQKTMEI